MPTDPLTDDLSAITQEELFPRIVRDVFFRGVPLLAYFRDHCLVPFGGGVFTQSIFRYAPHIGGAFGKGATFDISHNQTTNVKRFDRRKYEVNVTVDLADLAINRGSPQVVDMVDVEMDGAMRTMNTIIAIALRNHGQNVTPTSGSADDRTLEINGLLEMYNDGVSQGYRGATFPTYGLATRNGVVGDVLNSVPRWCGDSAGNPGMITYNIMLESYKDCVWDGKAPDLITSNIAANAFMTERLQVMQRLVQMNDPIWGKQVTKFENASIIEDRYAPSPTTSYGKNDALLGDYSTSTFTASTANATKSKLPHAGETCTAGEVIEIITTEDVMFRVSDHPLWGFGWTGFKDFVDAVMVAGQYLAMVNMECQDSRTGKILFGIDK